MMDEGLFRRVSDEALEGLKQSLIAAEEEGGFETEDNNGVLNVLFEDGSTKFVFTPQTPVRQVWISARTTSFKLDWVESEGAFVLAKTGESLKRLTERLLREQLNDPGIQLP
jgi:CyaY protein